MALNALQLLAKPNAAALKDMVEDALVPGVDVNDLVIDRPQPGAGTEMISRISVSSEAYGRPGFPYHGSVGFRYGRLSLEDTFGEFDLQFTVALPTTMSVVAGLMGTAFGMVFGVEDFIEENIADNNGQVDVILRANPDSPRWMGQIPIRLFRRSNN